MAKQRKAQRCELLAALSLGGVTGRLFAAAMLMELVAVRAATSMARFCTVAPAPSQTLSTPRCVAILSTGVFSGGCAAVHAASKQVRARVAAKGTAAVGWPCRG